MSGIRKIASLAVLAGVFFIVCGFVAAGKYPAGTSVNGTDISGLTYARAEAAVREGVRRELGGVQLKICVDGEIFLFRYPEVNVKTDMRAALAAAKRGGAHPLSKKYYLVRGESVLRGICDGFYRKSENAGLSFDASASEPFSYTAERSGRYLDGTVLERAVSEALQGGFGEIRLQTVRTPARVTLQKLRDMTCLLAKFTTRFNPAATGRAGNIALAGEKLSGTIVGAGEEFSFNRTVGERTKKNGFSEAPIIFEGDFVSGVGGGVCQASTTVYNAALLAGMEIKEYHPHSLSVGYVEPSFDAMVSGKNADLRFINCTGAPVYMVCRVADGAITVSLYGKKSAYTYRRESAVTEVVSPPEPEYAEGDNAKLRAAKDGLKSRGYLLTYKNGVLVGKKLLRKDSYAPVRAVLPAKKEEEENGDLSSRFTIS